VNGREGPIHELSDEESKRRLQEIADRLNALPLAPRPVDQKVDRAIKAADEQLQSPRPARAAGGIVWSDSGTIERSDNDDIPTE